MNPTFVIEIATLAAVLYLIWRNRMTDQSLADLETAVAANTTEVTAAVSEMQAGITEIGDLAAQIVAANGAGDSAQVETLAQQIASNTAALSTGVGALQTAIAGASPAPPAPPPASTLAIATTDLGAMVVGTPYSLALAFSGGQPPYAPSIASGALPDGLSMDAGGTITGTPTTATGYSVAIQVHDASSAAASESYSGTVAAS